ncbi:hypothetical protein H6P81_015866 [Aristolochia fimbriata]|uniref:Uncharacterized protein n=1 Tax=Aristolochia fimbriata TaxID=158543 RepID=A0AAV7E9R5_ARIFI|nr:hypothetical protein H6P81_015866 [Aristolochia fimbriata]
MGLRLSSSNTCFPENEKSGGGAKDGVSRPPRSGSRPTYSNTCFSKDEKSSRGVKDGRSLSARQLGSMPSSSTYFSEDENSGRGAKDEASQLPRLGSRPRKIPQKRKSQAEAQVKELHGHPAEFLKDLFLRDEKSGQGVDDRSCDLEGTCWNHLDCLSLPNLVQDT